jgi:hypothetical protein
MRTITIKIIGRGKKSRCFRTRKGELVCIPSKKRRKKKKGRKKGRTKGRKKGRRS